MHHLFEFPCIRIPRVTPLGRLVSSRRQGLEEWPSPPLVVVAVDRGNCWVGGEGGRPWRPGAHKHHVEDRLGAVGGQGSGAAYKVDDKHVCGRLGGLCIVNCNEKL